MFERNFIKYTISILYLLTYVVTVIGWQNKMWILKIFHKIGINMFY